MKPVVVPHGQYTEMRRQTSKKDFLQKHDQELATASTSERKKILAEIETEIELAINEETKKWGSSQNISIENIFKISRFKAGIVILSFIAALSVLIWAMKNYF